MKASDGRNKEKDNRMDSVLTKLLYAPNVDFYNSKDTKSSFSERQMLMQIESELYEYKLKRKPLIRWRSMLN